MPDSARTNKACSICGVSFPLAEFEYGRRPNRSYCQTCNKQERASLTIERTKAIYRDAVDARASDHEGPTWWAAVHAELQQVLAARSVAEAAKIIDWWHHDWSAIGDTAREAAGRLRAAARRH